MHVSVVKASEASYRYGVLAEPRPANPEPKLSEASKNARLTVVKWMDVSKPVDAPAFRSRFSVFCQPTKPPPWFKEESASAWLVFELFVL